MLAIYAPASHLRAQRLAHGVIAPTLSVYDGSAEATAWWNEHIARIRRERLNLPAPVASLHWTRCLERGLAATAREALYVSMDAL